MSRKVLFLAQKGQAVETGSPFYSWPRYCATFKLSQHHLLLKAQNILRNCLERFIYWLPALLFKGYSTVCRDAIPIISFIECYIPFPSFSSSWYFYLVETFTLLKCLYLKSKFQTRYCSNLNVLPFPARFFIIYRPLVNFSMQSFTAHLMYDCKELWCSY